MLEQQAAERGSASSRPLVSIGIPVHNGGKLLPRALDSILGQTYRDLEVIVSDNASTDETESVVLAYAERDPRLRYLRSVVNLGAPRNFNRAFALATGRYFKWASYDDELEPGFIEACVDVLEADPAAVACFSRGVIVDDAGRPLKPLPDRQVHLGDPLPHRRFADVIEPWYGCFHVWSLMRTDAIRCTRLHGTYPGSDRVFLAEMALQGPIRVVPETLFRLRHHGGRSVKSLPTIYDRARWHDTRKRGRAVLPHWRIGLEHLRAVRHVELAPGDRLRCYGELVRWIGLDWNWAKLGFDLVMAVAPGSLPAFVAGRDVVRRRRRARHAARSSAAAVSPLPAGAVPSDGEELGA